MHLGGKIEIQPKVPIRNRDDLSMIYTPGVARVCLALAENPDRRPAADDQAQHRRGRDRRLGGARAGQPRCDPRAAGDGGQGGAVQAVRRHRRVPDLPGHPGRRRDRAHRRAHRAGLRRASTSRTSRRRGASRSSGGCASSLDIPVFHDDQHGTAIVVLAALINALKVVGKRPRRRADRALRRRRGRHGDPDGAARGGRRHVVVADKDGVIHAGPPGPGGRAGARSPSAPTPTGAPATLRDALPAPTSSSASRRRTSSPATTSPRWPTGSIVFALANPVPEVDPVAASEHAAVVASGRSDFAEPDQQRAGLPRRLPRPARRAQPLDHRSTC